VPYAGRQRVYGFNGLASGWTGVGPVSGYQPDHPDAIRRDRSRGFKFSFEDGGVGAVVLPAWPQPATGRQAVVAAAAAAAIPVRTAAAGWTARDGELQIRALGPPYPIRGTRSDPNNNSLILQVRVRGMVLLLAGDAEGEEQRAVLDRLGPAALRADVLKVPHHGSAYQEPSFLDAVDPRVALVSVGAENTYGHPNLPVLDRLARTGARVLRTDTQGDLAAVHHDSGLAVVVRGVQPGHIGRAATSDTDAHKRQLRCGEAGVCVV
jgi:competence protein ComEC